MFTNDSSSSYEDYSSDDDDDYKKDPFNHELAEKSGVVDSKITNDNSHTVLNLLSRCIIHLDIDCFYCQCEEILNPHLAKKPLAIGQKHIVVTSNYAARKLGVKKLMGRNEALKVCPSLTIVEGSDLEKYKKASREVYIEFRRAVKEFGGENKVKKGCMDEMFADITFAVERHGTSTDDNSMNFKTNTPSNTFIYGEDGRSSIVKISETQSGAEATISNKPSSSVGGNFTGRYRYSNENNWGSVHERKNCEERLQIATIIASQVRERVRLKTKYSTTIGVSVSPMLSKLASDLKVRTFFLFKTNEYLNFLVYVK
jgi:nucleotidyltransferase/DNA polymerase involved in DNA repair